MGGLKQKKSNSPFLERRVPPREEESIPVLQAKVVLSASLPGMRFCAMPNFVGQAVSVGE